MFYKTLSVGESAQWLSILYCINLNGVYYKEWF